MEPHGLCPHLTPARATTDLCRSVAQSVTEHVCACLPLPACLLSAMDPGASSDMRRVGRLLDHTHAWTHVLFVRVAKVETDALPFAP